jgi:hypothetical protein
MSNANESTGDTEPMMQKRVRNLETGMVLAKPVYSSDGCTLLQEGTVLKSREIERLRGWNKRFVYVRPDERKDTPNESLPQAS